MMNYFRLSAPYGCPNLVSIPSINIRFKWVDTERLSHMTAAILFPVPASTAIDDSRYLKSHFFQLKLSYSIYSASFISHKDRTESTNCLRQSISTDTGFNITSIQTRLDQRFSYKALRHHILGSDQLNWWLNLNLNLNSSRVRNMFDRGHSCYTFGHIANSARLYMKSDRLLQNISITVSKAKSNTQNEVWCFWYWRLTVTCVISWSGYFER